MFEIRKQFEFSAMHYLPHLPEGHKCARPHGHNYIVEIVLQGELLNRDGFVVDYGDLDPLKRMIDERFDHRDLNTWFPGPTTAENLAQYFHAWCKSQWPQTVEVRVSETPKTWASYRPDPRLNIGFSVPPHYIESDFTEKIARAIQTTSARLR